MSLIISPFFIQLQLQRSFQRSLSKTGTVEMICKERQKQEVVVFKGNFNMFNLDSIHLLLVQERKGKKEKHQ